MNVNTQIGEWRYDRTAMKRNFSCVMGGIILLLLLTAAASAQTDGVQFVFMSAEKPAEQSSAPAYRVVNDAKLIKKYHNWLNNEAAKQALDLYQLAWRIAHKQDQADNGKPVYYIALIEDGNYADIGFRLRDGERWVVHTRTPYIKISPQPSAFITTFLHETGHVILYLLSQGKEIPVKQIAAIPHTTSALTDRGTAFNEGFAIHLETLAAHTGKDVGLQEYYHHHQFLIGPQYQRQSEYFRHSTDLLSYAQTRARYFEVRENNFAFAPAFCGPDYLRVQLEKSRDFTTLRDANQLLQSEGFYASFFFYFLLRGSDAPTITRIRERQEKMLTVLAQLLATEKLLPDTPYLLNFIKSYMEKYPAEAGEIADLLLDLSHGVFIDGNALAMWRDHYLGALRLYLAERNNEKITAARTRWRTSILTEPQIIFARIGPQLRCELPNQKVRLVAFGEELPVSFDANTVEEGIMRLIPGITDSEIENWISQRQQRPFSTVDEFKRRSGLSEKVLSVFN